MPSLLHKNFFFDASSGRQFVATDDGFYWKQAKKSPEDSKVTRLLQQHGWELKNGNDVWLIFKRPQQPGELFVIRGEKKWYFDMPNEPFGTDVPEGQGLASLQQALNSGVFGKPKAKAMTAAPLYTGPERRKDFKKRNEWDRRMMFDVSISQLREALNVSHDPTEQQEILNEIARLQEMQVDQAEKVGGAGSTAVNNAGSPRQIMHDDSGALTGLRNRPDYGESDSYTTQMNEANAKGASILVLNGGAKFGSETKKAKLFVTSAAWVGMELEKFTFSPDPRRACAFPKNTARVLASQLKGKFGVTANLHPAKG